MNTNASTATTTTTTITMMIHAVVLIRVPFCLADSGLGSRCTLPRNYPLDRSTRRAYLRNPRHRASDSQRAMLTPKKDARYAAWGRRLTVDELVTVAATASTSATVGLGLVVRAMGSRRSRRR